MKHNASETLQKRKRTRWDTASWIEAAKRVPGHENVQYDLAQYQSWKTKVTLRCVAPGCSQCTFEQKPDEHMRGAGCPQCARKKVGRILRDSQEEFIERARSHPNHMYIDYDLVRYVHSTTPVVLRCVAPGCTLGTFEQVPASHMTGRGCPQCGNKKKNATTRTSQADFIQAASSHPNNAYVDYTLVKLENMRTKVVLRCVAPGCTQGTFESFPDNHLRGVGCPECGRKKSDNARRLSQEEFIERARSHPNHRHVNYDLVQYVGMHTKVTLRCVAPGCTQGTFEQTPGSHVQGTGCPRCAKVGYSRSAIQWLDYVSTRDNIEIIHAGNNDGQEHTLILPVGKKTRVDGYCAEKNLVLEFHGSFWHGDPRVYDPKEINPITHCTFGDLHQRTLDREQRIRNAGYELMVMWEGDWDELLKQKKQQALQKQQEQFRSFFTSTSGSDVSDFPGSDDGAPTNE